MLPAFFLFLDRLANDLPISVTFAKHLLLSDFVCYSFGPHFINFFPNLLFFAIHWVWDCFLVAFKEPQAVSLGCLFEIPNILFLV